MKSPVGEGEGEGGDGRYIYGTGLTYLTTLHLLLNWRMTVMKSGRDPSDVGEGSDRPQSAKQRSTDFGQSLARDYGTKSGLILALVQARK